MVHANSVALFSLGLATLADAAAINHQRPSLVTVGIESSQVEKTSSPPTIYVTPSAAVTTAPITSVQPRPWYFDEFSKTFVQDAVAIRSRNVSEADASSVAKHLVDAGLDHPQYTSLASEAMQMWVDYGFQPNPDALYNFATNAKSAHDEIYQDITYWEYVDYVQTTAATVFDLSLLEPTRAIKNCSEAAASRAEQYRAAITSGYSSLYADPKGSAALETLDLVYSEYQRDFEGNGSRVITMTSGLLENILQNLFNIF